MVAEADQQPQQEAADHRVTANYTVRYIKITQDGGTFFVPRYAKNRPACRVVLRGNLFEPATHRLINTLMQRRPGSMIHAGTFFGDMLPSFARSCPATVYAFEPVLENYVLAKLCVEMNQLANVHLQNAGLSEKTAIGRVDAGSDGKHRGGTSTLSDKGQLVGLTTIDNLNLADIVVIQLDVEGHELPALKGARATMDRSSPVIMIEDNARSCDAFLIEMGYSHIGTIPGLFVWARPSDREMVEQSLSEA